MMLVVNGGTRLAYLNLLFGENNYLYLINRSRCIQTEFTVVRCCFFLRKPLLFYLTFWLKRFMDCRTGLTFNFSTVNNTFTLCSSISLLTLF